MHLSGLGDVRLDDVRVGGPGLRLSILDFHRPRGSNNSQLMVRVA